MHGYLCRLVFVHLDTMMHIGCVVWRVGNSILDKAQAAIAAAGRAAGASGMMSTSSIKTAPLFWPYLRKLTADSGNPLCFDTTAVLLCHCRYDWFEYDHWDDGGDAQSNGVYWRA